MDKATFTELVCNDQRNALLHLWEEKERQQAELLATQETVLELSAAVQALQQPAEEPAAA